ncbi:hypothetical protein SLEP1_g49626 [Rubroshorea leprosula]|uniref:Uncharacterized protein n=1 Tax=Rubroshorea leprosula TaxID=152421 RepID=A0AAV5LZG7_9ROSI|nr:hypothetical protein SLEP1_g49626 [Rubroshorea leprosula]
MSAHVNMLVIEPVHSSDPASGDYTPANSDPASGGYTPANSDPASGDYILVNRVPVNGRFIILAVTYRGDVYFILVLVSVFLITLVGMLYV